MASSSFNLCAWQSSRTTSFQVFFGLPLGLEPSTSCSIHFFTQSSSSFRNTWPYQPNNRLSWELRLIYIVPVAIQAILKPPPENWRWSPGRPRTPHQHSLLRRWHAAVSDMSAWRYCSVYQSAGCMHHWDRRLDGVQPFVAEPSEDGPALVFAWGQPSGIWTLDGSLVQPSSHVRDLGVQFDEDLSLKKHVDQLTGRCYSQLRRIRSCRRAHDTWVCQDGSHQPRRFEGWLLQQSTRRLHSTADRQSLARLELCRSCHPWRDATDSRWPELVVCSWAHHVQTLSARLQGIARPGSSLHQGDVCTSLVVHGKITAALSVKGPLHCSTHSARVRQARLRIRQSNSLEQSTWHYTKRWIH